MRTLSLGMLGLGTLLFLGCADAKTPEQPAGKTQNEEHDHDHEHAHGDPPHGGTLIELGEEEYHGELVHDQEAGTVTVYILDGHVENAVPIAAEEITISAQSQSYTLKAQPQEGEAQGQSSRFVSSDKELSDFMAGEDVHARLILQIEGQPYNGSIVIHR